MRRPLQTNMQFYAMQAGFIPFELLPERTKAEVESYALPGVWALASKLWWKRKWSARGWAWEPLQVK